MTSIPEKPRGTGFSRWYEDFFDLNDRADPNKPHDRKPSEMERRGWNPAPRAWITEPQGEHSGFRFFLPPYVPEGINELPLPQAALQYALAGWWVLPTAPQHIKNPGSVVGGRWQDKSTRDLQQIREWWEENPHYGIALHVGRSGAVAFDLDVDEMPEKFRDWLPPGLLQHTRGAGSARGHYVFGVPPGVQVGNAAGGFGPYGDVRGKGVIIAAPTPHPSGGQYRIAPSAEGRTLPALPDEAWAVVKAHAGEAAESATPDELKAFYASCTASDRPAALQVPVGKFTKGEGSRHERLVEVLPWAFREALAGWYPARAAATQLEEAFHAAFDGTEGRRPGPNEFQRAALWALAQARLADPEDTRRRMDRESGLPATDEEAFWRSRAVLGQVRQFARARRASPWAVLGVVLARVAAGIPPGVVLPPLTGGRSTLNLFVALCGPPGAGKGAAEAVGKEAVTFQDEPYIAPPGTGEGLVKQFAYKQKQNGLYLQVNVREAVLLKADEIDTLAALFSRSGATLLPELRKAWMGELLGFGYATPEKAVSLQGHRYRLAMTVGVQPGRSRVLFDDADGGTPQRFLWMPVEDPSAPDAAPPEPTEWKLAAWPGQETKLFDKFYRLDEPVAASELTHLRLPPAVARHVDDERVARLRGAQPRDQLDAHTTLMRLRVAALLMALDGRTKEVTDEDWALAETVMVVSQATRAQAQRALAAEAQARNKQAGRAQGARTAAAEEVLEESRLDRVLKLIPQHVEKHGKQTRRDLSKRLKLELRGYLDEAVDRLAKAGVVAKVPGKQGSYTVQLAGQ
ncbi:bifunctional DNA primase/polymerase [Lolliginicoccus levis]|uniref:bifunctional DNA primase/polymerase n=1 Tax=Lolliginicoccus levis TaxID=2919542 RepID=UPI00241F690B|nr:bifunctional DNA primase/polymerase [Lolliginicoccus levis]